MSAESLCKTLDDISRWGGTNVTWTGRFQDKPITLSPIHPLHAVEALTLRLGDIQISLSDLSTDIQFRSSKCSCCFDLVSPSEPSVWCRFLGCSDHSLPDESIHFLFSRIFQRTTNAKDLILYKIERPFQLVHTGNLPTALRIIHCAGLETFPLSLPIQTIHIRDCTNLTTIVSATNNTLQDLSIGWCGKLQSFSDFSSTSLQTLHVRWCQQLPQIGPFNLPHLNTLSIEACSTLEQFPDLSPCQHLERVRLGWFTRDIRLPNFQTCHKLRFVTLRSMAMTGLPPLPEQRLEWIDVGESRSLRTISLRGPRLRTLIADGCQQLRTVDVSNTPNLQKLSLARVSKLEQIYGLVENTSLQDVQISDAPTLTHLDGLETNFELRTLNLVNCPELTHLPNWRRLIQLQTLIIYGCRRLTALPSWMLPSLEIIKIGGCDAMKTLPTLAQFPNLHTLKYSAFTGTDSQIDLSPAKYLQEIIINAHPHLEEVLGLQHLSKLKVLDLSRCARLKKIDTLTRSSRLRQINLQGCRSLTHLPPLFHLQQLEDLSVSHCEALRRLDCLYLHPYLRYFNISHCPNLERLPLLHPQTRQHIRQLYCTDLPQPIDISKVIGGIDVPNLQELHVENTNLISRTPIEKCINIQEITGLSDTLRWLVLLKIAIAKRNDDWIVKHWSTCLQHISPPHTEELTNACIEAGKFCASKMMIEQLFFKLRTIEHASTGDSLIPAPIWENLFGWLYKKDDWLFSIFAPILTQRTIKIDLMREENWFPVLIDVCLKKKTTSRHRQLLENLYQRSLFRNTPMYDHLRNQWLD